LGKHSEPLAQVPSSTDLEGIHSWVQKQALPGAHNLLRETLGPDAVEAVAVFDYTLRFEDPPKDPPPHLQFRTPVAGAHADFTPKSGPLRLHKILSNG